MLNGEIKRILEKTINTTKNNWLLKLDDALGAHRTTSQASLGMSRRQLVYGKACLLLVELKRKSYWALKKLNLDSERARDKCLFQLQRLEEFPLPACENLRIYKGKTKYY